VVVADLVVANKLMMLDVVVLPFALLVATHLVPDKW